jgi:hypothetical protein
VVVVVAAVVVLGAAIWWRCGPPSHGRMTADASVRSSRGRDRLRALGLGVVHPPHDHLHQALSAIRIATAHFMRCRAAEIADVCSSLDRQERYRLAAHISQARHAIQGDLGTGQVARTRCPSQERLRGHSTHGATWLAGRRRAALFFGRGQKRKVGRRRASALVRERNAIIQLHVIGTRAINRHVESRASAACVISGCTCGGRCNLSPTPQRPPDPPTDAVLVTVTLHPSARSFTLLVLLSTSVSTLAAQVAAQPGVRVPVGAMNVKIGGVTRRHNALLNDCGVTAHTHITVLGRPPTTSRMPHAVGSAGEARTLNCAITPSQSVFVYAWGGTRVVDVDLSSALVSDVARSLASRTSVGPVPHQSIGLVLRGRLLDTHCPLSTYVATRAHILHTSR